MRQALNSNPVVQLAVIGVAGVLFAVLMFTTVLKKDEAPAGPQQPTAKDLLEEGGATQAAGAVGSAAAAAPSTPDPAPEAVPSTPDPAPVPATPPAGSSGSDGLLPSKGLPEDLLVAYARDKAIALLVIDKNGISDKAVKSYTERLAPRDDVEVFTVKAKNISDYSRITQGVNVSQAPALIVIRPRDKTGDRPRASVSYGFRSAKSVEVALEDALYSGGKRPAFPE
jgi:hypothetical protein